MTKDFEGHSYSSDSIEALPEDRSPEVGSPAESDELPSYLEYITSNESVPQPPVTPIPQSPMSVTPIPQPPVTPIPQSPMSVPQPPVTPIPQPPVTPIPQTPIPQSSVITPVPVSPLLTPDCIASLSEMFPTSTSQQLRTLLEVTANDVNRVVDILQSPLSAVRIQKLLRKTRIKKTATVFA